MSLPQMRSSLALLLPFGAPLGALVVFRAIPNIDVVYQDVQFHLVVVSTVAACALVVALLAARAGSRAAQPGPVLMAVGCMAVGITMLAHGLLTPGVLSTPYNAWVGRVPYLGILAFAASLAAASRPRNTRLSSLAARRPSIVLGVPSAVLGGLAILLVARPTALFGTGPVPFEDPAKWAIALGASALLAGMGLVHWHRWRLGNDPVQYSLVLACAMCTAAVVSLRVGELWRLSWWDYHVFLLTGFGAAVVSILLRYRRIHQVDMVLGATFDADPMTHIVAGYPDALRALVRAVEVKDAYTHGHSERTARIAVQLGVRLGLDEDGLAALARGAELHDVGKIAIPDQILNKPGSLTPEEREVIETHPQVGYELVAPVSALERATPAVLHHHERWDGTGYPSGLAGTAIPMLARIVAIADVWDALTSDRSYRIGMDPDVALAHIVAGRGSHFEPALVDAFLALAADWGYGLTWTQGDADEAWRAAETCHEVLVTTRD